MSGSDLNVHYLPSEGTVDKMCWQDDVLSETHTPSVLRNLSSEEIAEMAEANDGPIVVNVGSVLVKEGEGNEEIDKIKAAGDILSQKGIANKLLLMNNPNEEDVMNRRIFSEFLAAFEARNEVRDAVRDVVKKMLDEDSGEPGSLIYEMRTWGLKDLAGMDHGDSSKWNKASPYNNNLGLLEMKYEAESVTQQRAIMRLATEQAIDGVLEDDELKAALGRSLYGEFNRPGEFREFVKPDVIEETIKLAVRAVLSNFNRGLRYSLKPAKLESYPPRKFALEALKDKDMLNPAIADRLDVAS